MSFFQRFLGAMRSPSNVALARASRDALAQQGTCWMSKAGKQLFVWLSLVALIAPIAPTFAQTPPATTTTLTTSVNPTAAGGSTTFTATVTGDTPTGTVTFRDGAVTIGSPVALSGNVATLAVSNLASGTHNITAVYSGDADDSTSTSAVLTQTVNVQVDPSFGSVALLLHGNGANDSTTFVDSSASPKTITAVGNARIRTDLSPMFGSGAMYFDGTGDQLTMPNSADFRFGTGDYTVEFWIKAGTVTNYLYVFQSGDYDTNQWSVRTNNTGKIEVYFDGGANALGVFASSSSVPLNAWAHVAVSRAAGTTRIFIDGEVKATSTAVYDVNGTTGLARIGSRNDTSLYQMNGSLDEMRITKGVARYTANFTPPSAAFLEVAAHTLSSAALTSSTNPAEFGTPVTFTATVTGDTPTGTVTFYDGSTEIGSTNLISGVATFGTPLLSVGSHSIMATYNGNSANGVSTSDALALSVNANPSVAMQWRFGYDAMGRPTTTVDPRGMTTRTYYDSLGRPIQTEQPANVGTTDPTVTGFEYDLASSLTKVIDPRNLHTTYAPNGLGEVQSQLSPDSGATSYTYNAKGNVLTRTDARGKVTTRTYDSLDRVTSISYPTGTATTLEYDGGSTPTSATRGELTKITDESGSVTYAYDALGRMTSKTQVTGAQTFTVTYSWGDTGTAMDKLTAITYPSGSRVNYSYDAEGYLSAITVNPVNTNGVGVNTGSTLNLLSGITYNVDNHLKGWTWQDGSAQLYSFDSYGLLSGYNLGFDNGTSIAAGARRTIVRDAAGRITGYTHVNNAVAVPSLDQAFGYDNLDRLRNVTLSAVSTQYTYDATGNRTTKVVGATTYTNTVAPTSNRVTQTQDVGGTFNISHDAAGNVTGDGTNTFTYSDRGRMATAVNAGGTVNYQYNALNLRMSKVGPTALVPTGAAYFVYDEQGQLLGEYDANGAPVYETIYLGTLPVGALKRTGTAGGNNLAVSVYNVHADHLGAARIITRPSDKAIVWRWDTAESYGGSAASENPSSLGAFTFNQRFPGQVFDAETGLFQNWNREYNPRMGRYVQSDPIGLAGGINTYSYVAGNPISMVDPNGEFGIPGAIAGGFIGAIGGGFGAAATGGNVFRGVVIGALGGAVVGGSGVWLSGLVANVGVRVGAGLVGNALGQMQNVGEPNFKGLNVGSLAGSGVGAALGGTLAAGAWGTRFSGGLASQVGQRSLAGIPGGSVSAVSNVIGTMAGKNGVQPVNGAQPLVCR